MSKMIRAAAALMVSGAVASCEPSPDPISAESRFLEETLVPRLFQWRAGPEDLPLADISRQRGYDFICIVPEYTDLEVVEGEVGPIKSFDRRFRGMVPETHVALVAIKGDKAHTALMSYHQVSFWAPPTNRCVSGERATFVSVPLRKGRHTPSARLQEK